MKNNSRLPGFRPTPMKLTLVVSMGMLLLLTACKKETVSAGNFSPFGYWKGYWYAYNTAILNRVNGTSRVYILIPNGDDTASAVYKIEGKFSVNGSVFRSDYYVIND